MRGWLAIRSRCGGKIDSGAMEMIKILKKSILFHGASPPCQVMAGPPNAWFGPPNTWFGPPNTWLRIHGLDLQMHGLDIQMHGSRCIYMGWSSFRELETAVWHRLDADLTGSGSYFGLPVSSKKTDFYRPWVSFCSIWPVRPRQAQVHLTA